MNWGHLVKLFIFIVFLVKKDSSLKLTEARGEALKIKNQALGYKYRTILKAEGETQKYTKVYDSYLLNKKVFITTKMIETMSQIYTNVNQLNFVDPSIGAVPLLGLNQSMENGLDNYLKDKIKNNTVKWCQYILD